MTQVIRQIVIGGAAGQGLVTVGQLFCKALIRAGYEVLVTQHYMSRVRGGHNTFCIRVSDEPVRGASDVIDVLIALQQETVSLHKHELAESGLILLDEQLDSEGASSVAIPFSSLAPRAIFQNVAALGVVAAIWGVSKDIISQLLRETFGKKGDEIVEKNLAVLDDAYAFGAEHQKDCKPLPSPKSKAGRMMIQGNDAVALGAMAAGVKFCSFYPMTPATSIAQALITHSKKMGIVVEQAEDEIAAANMALGASYAGAPTIVPTSGGGFALMTEVVSLAGVMEQPVVFALAQRPGPATGLPTRTEQADLNLALYSGHGEYPRAIFAPCSVEECFHSTYKAFDIAEKYQSPVFVLTDQILADQFTGVEPFDLNALSPVTTPDLTDTDAETYMRYAYSESGVSPRRIPGYGKSLVLADCHEHTEDGHITEDIDVRIAMNDKRLRKEEGMRSEVIPPRSYGPESPELLLVCWGTTEGPVREVMERLNAAGKRVGVLSFSQVWPLNEAQFLPLLTAAEKVVCVEGNATAQFAKLLRQETGFAVNDVLLRYDGRPFSVEYLWEKLA